jgi:hypothetical protein
MLCLAAAGSFVRKVGGMAQTPIAPSRQDLAGHKIGLAADPNPPQRDSNRPRTVCRNLATWRTNFGTDRRTLAWSKLQLSVFTI